MSRCNSKPKSHQKMNKPILPGTTQCFFATFRKGPSSTTRKNKNETRFLDDLRKCGRDEDVQSVLTLFCSGAAQVVCYALRVVELREQLEVEEEDGDRQEEEEEVESGETSQRECAMNMTMDGDMKVLRT